LLIGIVGGQEWLEGGYVSSYGSNPDEGLSGMLQWLYQPVSAFPWYHTGGAFYPGPYGVYPFSPSPYYSDFRLNSLAGMNWEPFQKNWSETMNYAQANSSFRVYPRPNYTSPLVQYPASTYTTTRYLGSMYRPTRYPVATTGDSTVTIMSQGMRGYQVYLDGNYIGTEGTGGDSLDGKFTFKVPGNQYHEVRVYDGQFNYPKTMFFDRGGTKIIHVEHETAVYT
jgi:hypothetical protein